MSGKATLRCVGFKPIGRGSLRGFASIAFLDLKMTVHGVGIHVHENGAAGASPPAEAIIKGSVAVKDERGKIAYNPPLFEFRGAGVRPAWSDAVIRAVLAYDETALNSRESAP